MRPGDRADTSPAENVESFERRKPKTQRDSIGNVVEPNKLFDEAPFLRLHIPDATLGIVASKLQRMAQRILGIILALTSLLKYQKYYSDFPNGQENCRSPAAERNKNALK
jgi:hypothetical protein